MDVPFDAEPYFNNPAFSDVEIRFSSRSIQAHRIFLCSKSPYFQKALGPDSQFKENGEGVLKLKEDDPIAVEEMLRYVYTSTYREAHNGYWDFHKVTWETHLNVMIVADKYGLPNLEKLAFDKCAQAVKAEELTGEVRLVLFRLVERSWEYADREGRFAAMIADLPEMRAESFLYLFEDESVRSWVDANPEAATPLIEKHFRLLMKRGSFRKKISSDSKMALEQLDRLLSKLYG